MRFRLSVVLALGLALTTAASSQAYPISPQPLWKLVGESELIVVAEVVEIKESAVHKPLALGKDIPSSTMVARGATTAVLRILETWKGNQHGTIEVEYPAGLICPAPPVYVKGEDVLAFLKWRENVGSDEKGWGTVGLSYGTLYPDRQELADFREMVRQAIALQAKKPVPEAALLGWLAEAAARPGTRWHGLYPLLPRSDEVRSYYDHSGITALHGKLTAAHLERIARGFIDSPSVDVTLPMALAVLAGYRSKAVDEAALSAMEGLFGQKKLPYWILDALQRVLERFEGKKAGKRLASLRTAYEKSYEIDEDDTREVWRKARQELNLPKVVPTKVPGRKVWGVGETTPS